MATKIQQVVTPSVMRGRDIIIAYLKALKVDYLFGVPGTNEIPIIDGTQEDGPKANGATASTGNPINYIPCLHENIAMGAAMGYARTTGKPGVVMLHVTPGIGHALGNLFNAQRSHMPVLVLCGQQHSQLTLQEPLLYSETVRVAEQYTRWSYEIRTPEEFPMVLQRALKLVITPPTGPVFLSIPWNFALHEFPGYQPESARVTRIATNFLGAADALEQAATALKSTDKNTPPPVIIVGDGVGAANAWNELQQVVEKTGAYVFSEGMSSMMNYPPGDYHYMGELPGTQEQMQQVILKPNPQGPQTRVVFLCGFNAQAQIVAYKYEKGPLIPKEIKQVVYLHNDPWEIGKNHYGEVAILGDIKLSLGELAKRIPDNLEKEARKQQLEALRKQRDHQRQVYLEAVTRGKQGNCHGRDTTIPAEEVARMLGELQREGLGDGPLKMVLINEAVSDSQAFQDHLNYDCPTSYFCAEGGSLGFSMPASIGIRLGLNTQGEEERVVVNVVGDGSTLFYPHTWWTTHAFGLPILYIITNNKAYRTLQIGLREVETLYHWTPSRDPDYLEMCHPSVDFQKIAESFELTHVRLATSKPAEVKAALKTALLTVTGKLARAQKRSYVLEILTEEKLPPTAVLEQFPVSIMEILP